MPSRLRLFGNLRGRYLEWGWERAPQGHAPTPIPDLFTEILGTPFEVWLGIWYSNSRR